MRITRKGFSQIMEKYFFKKISILEIYKGVDIFEKEYKNSYKIRCYCVSEDILDFVVDEQQLEKLNKNIIPGGRLIEEKN